MELRDIEIFLTLAEELHFGRSAERLHVSTARVSQAIKKQERAIGAPLFERTSRHARLTPVGEALLAGLKPGYEALHDAVAEARALAAGAAATLRLGVMGAQMHEMAPALADLRSAHPAAELQFKEVFFSDPFGALRTGQVDAITTWLPVNEPDLTVGAVLRQEPLNLVVAANHPLAQKDSVSLEALGDVVVPRLQGNVPRSWEGAVVPFHTPSGRPIRRGPDVATFNEVLALVAGGDVVCTVPDEGRRYNRQSEVVYLPVVDAAPVRWALVWPTDRVHPLARALAEITANAPPA